MTKTLPPTMDAMQTLSPQAIDALFSEAVAHHQAGNHVAAEADYRRLLAAAPGHCFAHNNLGILLQGQGQIDDAVRCYHEALRLKPDYPDACNNLGTALHALQRYDAAITAYRSALRLNPQYPDAIYNLGKSFQELQRLDEASAAYHACLRLRPNSPAAHVNLGMVLQTQGKHAEALSCYQNAIALRPDYSQAHSNLLFILQYSVTQPRSELLAAHRRFAEVFETPLKPQWPTHQNLRDEKKRLKIGYVSADFRRHAVASFIEPVLDRHDKSAFEIYCYFSHNLHDEISDRIQVAADHWIPCAALSDSQLAERILSDGIDILIDLSGHTAHNRMLTFARKPAPVQMTYLGYPGTSGLSAMDYRITDGYADPEGSDQYYAEKLLRLPDSLCCFRPAPNMPEVSPSPALKNGYLTFGSLNNFNKLDQESIRIWAEILMALPTARLLIATVPTELERQQLEQQFAALSVTADRLDFHGKLPAEEFYRLFQQVDVAFDPLLVGGGTTTCESLAMGVPVIVLIRQRFLGRIGYSFLCAAGLSEYAAATHEDYVKIAVALAGKIPQLAAQRADMRKRLATAPLMDEIRFAHNLELVYRDAWKAWCRNSTT